MPRHPDKTRLDDDVTKPPTTAPGDAPYDTMDPDEHATTIVPRPGRQALLEGRVNAAVPLPRRDPPERDSKDDRMETYDVEGPDGEPVSVTRNVETGEVVDTDETDATDRTDATRPVGESDAGATERRTDAPTATSATSTGARTERPSDRAGKPEWVDYAVAKGADRDTAAEMSRADLIVRYGS